MNPERAPYASDPLNNRGRAFGTSPSPTRSAFQRDRDRIIHSTAFRRLQYKTQVFLQHEGQHFRTRLTHTLEVSQIARSIARALRLDEDLAEAVALAHDLGHTPFGHAGERVLHQRMSTYGGFDHNVQALRVVTLLENRYADHDGLNLTIDTLDGILKHNGPVPEAELEGLQLDALDVSSHAALEAQVAAIADDIAYNAHDIDDALRAGLIGVRDLFDVPLVGPIAQHVMQRWPDIEPGRQAHEIQRRLITLLIENTITASASNIAELAPQSVDDVQAAGRALVSFSPEVATAERALKTFLFGRIYRSEAVMGPVRASEALVGALFDRYITAGDMPGRWGAAFRDASAKHRPRIVSDFIAGMTDPYAVAEHARLFDAAPRLG